MSGLMFKPVLIRQIARGKKTMTRRPVKPGEDRCRYVPGRTYAVQPGRGKPSDGMRVLITDVRSELLDAITYDDARAEGFRTTDEFRRYWVRIHDAGWVARLEQRYHDGELETWDHVEDAVLERFTRHRERLVWVITFEVEHDTPRYLHAHSERGQGLADRPGQPLGSGYTTNTREALPDEPEAIDVRRLERHWREDASQRHAQALADRLARAQAAAAAAGVDVRHLERAIEQRVKALERRVGEAA